MLTRFALRRLLPIVTAVLRLVWPTPRFGRVVIVTRRADVEEVLDGMARFPVVYGPEMKELGGAADNVLSVDGSEHDRLLDILHRSLTRDDVIAVREWVREDAEALLRAGGGRIDVIKDLVTRTATEAACRLFGITAHDPDRFAEWTMAVSNQLFGDFLGDRNIRTQAQTAAAHLRAAIDDAIARVENNNREHPRSDRERVTVIDRMITEERMTPAEVRASILGLVTAFVPTNTLAAGNMLEVLLERPSLMGRALRAARDGKRSDLRDVLLIAGRLNPALSPGLWRHVPQDSAATIIGAGWSKRKIRPGDVILACIPSALRDRRGNKPGREAAGAKLMFGHGPHYCAGDELALAHLVSAFEQLFKQEELALAPGRHGKIARTGPYPTRLDMTYRAPCSRRAMMILTFPVRPGVARKRVEDALDKLGNPAADEVRDSLDRTKRVQFLSLSVIEREPDSEESVLILEISGDGDDSELLERIACKCHSWLAPLLAFCSPGVNRDSSSKELASFLRSGRRPLHQWPWGSTGLHFDGLPELSVAAIERQERVARFASEAVQKHLSRELGLNTRAMDILSRTRRLLKRDPWLTLRASNRALMEAAPERGAIIKPSRTRLSIADWRWWTNILSPVPKMLLAPDNRFLLVAVLTLVVGWTAGLLFWLLPAAEAWPVGILAVIACLVGGVLLTVLTMAGLGWLFLATVRRKEKAEPVDERMPDLEHVADVSRREDAPGCAQNHIIAVMPFKPGLVRRLSFALAMWGIKQSVSYWFRPGYVVSMGTIHKARWLRVHGTNQFVFFSNFDGSWESYLEDFITRAHEGQSAAWSHGIGFPRTRFLIGGGAEDGDRFKRWVRRQQRPSLCWYSRFPHLTAQQIRRNAMIEDGLARAVTDTDSRRWLSLFGSAQGEPDELETQEAQTLIFSGFPGQVNATALFLRLPDGPGAAAGWLKAVTGLSAKPFSAAVGPPDRWLHRLQDGSTAIRLPEEARVSFGERRVRRGGAALAFTAGGLEKAGLSEECGLAACSATFRMGMARRSATLGDDPGDRAAWRISDAPERSDSAHAVLMIYGRERGLTHRALVDGHRLLLTHFGGSVCHEVPCSPARGDGRLDVEHFGFRDGISQPVIRGTRRAAAPVPDRDLVPAGEFLLGYRNMQGFVSPAIAVGAEHDPGNDLPTPEAADSNRYPFFGSREGSDGIRDFGRNGCFVAIRQLDQDVDGFERQLRRSSAALKRHYRGLKELAGGAVSAEWLAARIIGRWRDGSPLVGNADCPAGLEPDEAPANDFAYGIDDPRGLACPLGAHVRRANPRDSQEPADADEQRITNRHRLLRRGRAYAYEADGPGSGQRTGLLFIALCADLERQFEFVQRSWLNATSFHGLVGERDPLLGGPASPASPNLAGAAEPGGFTIPTAAGPVRIPGLQSYVRMRGGGYFFLPSRSAFAFLVNRSTRLASSQRRSGDSG